MAGPTGATVGSYIELDSRSEEEHNAGGCNTATDGASGRRGGAAARTKALADWALGICFIVLVRQHMRLHI
jgi:hypothetical protein